MQAEPDTATPARGGDDAPGPERLNALCDGVVAIALTLLALDIRLPHESAAPLREQLRQLLPAVASFALSFIVIGSFWLAHQRLTRHVRRASRGYNLAGIGFMLLLVSLNFPTAVLAHYGDGEPLAVALYAAVVAATGLVLLVMVALAHRQGLAAPAPDPRRRGAAVLPVAWLTLVFAASIPLASWSATVAMWSWLLAALAPLARRVAG